MSRKKLTRRSRRIGIALLFAAMAIPATAQSHPFDDTSPSRGAIHGSSPQMIKVPTDPGQARVTDERPLPRGVVLRKSGPVDQGPKLAPVRITSVQQTSTFDWTDALIGAGVTAPSWHWHLAGPWLPASRGGSATGSQGPASNVAAAGRGRHGDPSRRQAAPRVWRPPQLRSLIRSAPGGFRLGS